MKSIFIYNGDKLVKELAILHDGYWYCQYAVRNESNVLSVISLCPNSISFSKMRRLRDIKFLIVSVSEFTTNKKRGDYN